MSFKDKAIGAAQAAEQQRQGQAQQARTERQATLRDRKTQCEAKAVEHTQAWFQNVTESEPRPDQVMVVDYFYLQLSNGYANMPDNTPGIESWMTCALLTWIAEGEKFVAQFSKTFKNDTSISMRGPGSTHESFEVWVRGSDGYMLALTKEELGAALLGRGYLKRNPWEHGGTWSPKFTVTP